MDELNQRYLKLLRRYDAEAMRCKRRRTTIWAVGLFCTWLPLMLAVAGLAKWLHPNADPIVLHLIIPAVHTLGGTLVVVQVVGTHRGRWLQYRAACERLRSQAMHFRTKRIENEDVARQSFGKFLDELTREVEQRKRWSMAGMFSPRWRAALKMIELPNATSPPDEGLTPRTASSTREEAIALVRNRSQDQINWHYRKAGQYYRRYLGWQALLLLTFASSASLVWFLGHKYEVVLLGSVGLIVNAIRDFMEYGPLSWRYAMLAEELRATAAQFEKELQSSSEYLRVLEEWSEVVEDRLTTELRSWYQIQEIVAND